jgi:hypothetical protein
MLHVSHPYLFIPSLHASFLNSQDFLFTCILSTTILGDIYCTALVQCGTEGVILVESMCMCRNMQNIFHVSILAFLIRLIAVHTQF